jgi:hypothetical protein
MKDGPFESPSCTDSLTGNSAHKDLVDQPTKRWTGNVLANSLSGGSCKKQVIYRDRPGLVGRHFGDLFVLSLLFKVNIEKQVRVSSCITVGSTDAA